MHQIKHEIVHDQERAKGRQEVERRIENAEKTARALQAAQNLDSMELDVDE